ncbi:hypothetical protein BCV70DRAFT_88962 [Testicularia cyperi]|uniref:Uncharacterized protein n=1 Tax=Testicularia cyperi TaxID=1882483 RepID=A0A317XRY3_9BASI|nr:hypothetical protein BCV70DRAFT_88962 [Testicularia cyperi]
MGGARGGRRSAAVRQLSHLAWVTRTDGRADTVRTLYLILSCLSPTKSPSFSHSLCYSTTVQCSCVRRSVRTLHVIHCGRVCCTVERT